MNIVGAKYFETFGIPIVRGRDFTDADQPSTPAAVIVNETMAKRFWPDQDPLGKRFKFFGQDHFQQVVAIARDSKYNFIGEEPTPFIYQTLTQVYDPNVSLFVKSDRPTTVVGTVRREVQQMDAHMPITNEIYRVLYEGKNPLAAVKDLMLREPRSEKP